MSELLFEIGTEEIPAGYIKPALSYFEQAAKKHFGKLDLGHGKVRTMGTPRRLTLVVEDLQGRQPNKVVEHKGPSKQAGIDSEGNPTKAAIGFAGSRGMAAEELKVVETPKGEYLVAVEDVKGRATGELLPDVLKDLIIQMPFPKSMRWGQGEITFARPIQWLLALHDGELIEFSIEGISSGRITRGHRFMASQPFSVTGFDHYLHKLKENRVVVDQDERRELVIAEVKKAVQENGSYEGAEPVLDDKLIDTVTNLVEVPWGVCGSFDTKFLELPREVLVTSMREHQKYFPVIDTNGKLLPLFVAVNNTRIDDLELAVSGHQRVLRARLEDALFFFREDKKKKLGDRQHDLEGIVFQNKLGSMFDKAKRIAALSEILAAKITPENMENAGRAAMLAKCDLLTEMVGEFPSLQGVMGREYALLDGENMEVAVAVHEHYKPVRAGDDLPGGLVGATVGIADRADTLAGCFAIGEKPTGTTDPFGLRRLALGMLNIIQGHAIHISLNEIIRNAVSSYEGVVDIPGDTVDQLMEFIRLRFENDVIAAGVRPETVIAATSVGFDDVVDCRTRIGALASISSREQFTVLAGSFKRINNIIKDNSETSVDDRILAEGAEKDLYNILVSVKSKISPLIEKGQYDDALETMLEMKEPVDRFFDDVMVMTEDQAVRQNRLNLLTALGEMVLKVGDISKMHQEGNA
jgi:glycyl-tRNA synthetase beta chain